MQLSSSTPHKKARIEIIPLIDIMFFLLASFMLVSMSMIRLQGIPNNLPGPSKAPSLKTPDFQTIGIDSKGEMYFNKEANPIRPDELPGRLQPFYAQQRDELKVFINVDKDAKYDALITALDYVRAMGISKVSFAIKKDHVFDPKDPKRMLVPVSSAPSGGPPSNPPPNPPPVP